MTTTVMPPSQEVLADCVRLATAAPSLHNSQPWLFRVGHSAIEVYADRSRRLAVLDPAGREQLISVGAALFTLRLGLRRAGYRPETELFPQPDRPHFVARVTPVVPEPASAAAEALVEAVPHRHTNRWPFAQAPVAPEALEHLRDAARREGAVLTVANASSRAAILELGRTADRRLRARPGYREELSRWIGEPGRRDGVPPAAAGPWDALESIPVRDFVPYAPRSRRHVPFEPYPTILVLATAGDEGPDWVRAGQALQSVLLTATWQGLATTPISQPVEVPPLRRMLTDPTGGLSAQMVIRVGYGRTIGSTPRRSVEEVLLPPR
jgi:nitroreductase